MEGKNAPVGSGIEKMETKTFSAGFIKDKAKAIFESQKIKPVKVESIADRKSENGEISFVAKIATKKGAIPDLQVRLFNKAGILGVDGTYHFILDEMLARLKADIETEEGKKINKMEIVNGELAVTFDKDQLHSVAPALEVEAQKDSTTIRTEATQQRDVLNTKIEYDVPEMASRQDLPPFTLGEITIKDDGETPAGEYFRLSEVEKDRLESLDKLRDIEKRGESMVSEQPAPRASREESNKQEEVTDNLAQKRGGRMAELKARIEAARAVKSPSKPETAAKTRDERMLELKARIEKVRMQKKKI
jgi:hypothetical protein